MSFQSPITIAQAIQKIETNRLLLPAIQREFVWWHNSIEWLFDSLMRDYPINSFLFWRVEGESKTAFRYYKFLRTYRQYFQTHNEEINTAGLADFEAVLDGQQRLTALYIGLKGSFAYKNYRAWKEDTERSIPTRYLFLDLSKSLSSEEEEDGRLFNFQFKTLEEVEYDGGNQKWFRVGNIIKLGDNYDFNKFLDENNYKQNEFAYRALSKLQNVIHTKGLINYYLETEPDYHKALNIFIRVNVGGQRLDYSDLLMSTTVAGWDKLDARQEFNSLRDIIRDKGYSIGYDYILKTYLILHSKDIKFRVSNFDDISAKDFQSKWPAIRDTIQEVFKLINSLGFTEHTLTSKNALLPIIYWLYSRNIFNDYCTKIEFKDERKAIHKWLNIVLLKQIFGGSADNINKQIRDLLAKEIASGTNKFPVSAIAATLRGTSRDLSVDEEFINGLLLTQKDDRYAFPILALLYPEKDYKGNLFHKDHLHPCSLFNKLSLKNHNIPEESYDFYLNPANYNSILNLQILDGNENMSKQDISLREWIESSKCDPDAVILPKEEDKDATKALYDFNSFRAFIELRRVILTEKLKKAFELI